MNDAVNPKVLDGHVPCGWALDTFGGKTYLSLVGFEFRRSELLGWLPTPFHRSFPEVNLRYYVRRREGNEIRRGVAFLAESVPKFAVAKLARLAYGEKYLRLPMKHRMESSAEKKLVEYRWKWKSAWCTIRGHSSVSRVLPGEGRLEQFITERYWGYSAQRSGGTLEYRVAHERWPVRPCDAAYFAGEVGDLYGGDLGPILKGPPDSAFLVDGSPVTVFRGREIR